MTEYCTNCQQNVTTFTVQEKYLDVRLTRIFCEMCNRELYNFTSEERAKEPRHKPVNRKFKFVPSKPI